MRNKIFKTKNDLIEMLQDLDKIKQPDALEKINFGKDLSKLFSKIEKSYSAEQLKLFHDYISIIEKNYSEEHNYYVLRHAYLVELLTTLAML